MFFTKRARQPIASDRTDLYGARVGTALADVVLCLSINHKESTAWLDVKLDDPGTYHGLACGMGIPHSVALRMVEILQEDE